MDTAQSEIIHNVERNDAYDTNLDFHGFVATKKRKCESTYITSTKMVNIVNGSKVLSIYGRLTSTLTPVQLGCIFSSRSQISNLVIQVSCLYYIYIMHVHSVNLSATITFNT